MTTPVSYRVGRLTSPAIQQSAEVLAESDEVVPYPQGSVLTADSASWPPAGFAALVDEDDETVSNTSNQDPIPYNLSFVQGDTFTEYFDFYDVLWLPEDPAIVDPDAPEWVEAEWGAQVRNPYLWSAYSVDRWTPINNSQYVWWRANSWIADFTCTAEVYEVPDTDPQQYATRVHVKMPANDSRAIIPGNHYYWDLQARIPNEDSESHEDDDVFTMLSGRVRVRTQWTTS